jgi:NAD(P)H-dependent flavin oxidoreductase YrpB (nitropropane dioxygenase family)
MGGGLAGAELAAAVSEAGGLGTVGILGPEQLREELAAARRRTDKPIAVNLLLVLARPAHFEVAEQADILVTFWGRPRRRTSRTWIHQVGSVEEALEAQRAGADGVIAQGVEAGGHVRGTTKTLELLERVRSAVGAGYPVLSAGGIADASDAGQRLEAGAEGVVSGTRFLMSEESGGHPAYKQRLIGARETVLTELFGLVARRLPGTRRAPAPARRGAAAGPTPVRPGRGDRGRAVEPRRRRSALRRRIDRADRRHPPGGGAGGCTRAVARHATDDHSTNV